MSNLVVKQFISTEILNKMQDQSKATILRNILFDKNNIIDWNNAKEYIFENMPELKLTLDNPNELC